MTGLKLLFLLLIPVLHLNGQYLINFKDINGKYGFKDSNGMTIINPVFDKPIEFIDNAALVKSDRIYLINNKGKVLFICNYPRLDYECGEKFCDGLLLVRDSTTFKFGYINTNGEWVIPPKFHEAQDFRFGFANVWEDIDVHPDYGSGCGTPVAHSKWGIIGKNGIYLIRPLFILPALITEKEITFEHWDKIYKYNLNGVRIE